MPGHGTQWRLFEMCQTEGLPSLLPRIRDRSSTRKSSSQRLRQLTSRISQLRTASIAGMSLT